MGVVVVSISMVLSPAVLYIWAACLGALFKVARHIDVVKAFNIIFAKTELCP